MYELKLKHLFSDKEFLSKLFKTKSQKEVEVLFLSMGVSLTIEELEEICDIIEACSSHIGKIPDDKLDRAVGGVSNGIIRGIIKENMHQINQIICGGEINQKF